MSIGVRPSLEEIYLYALVGVSALCLVILVALIAVSVGLCVANSRYRVVHLVGL